MPITLYVDETALAAHLRTADWVPGLPTTRTTWRRRWSTTLRTIIDGLSAAELLTSDGHLGQFPVRIRYSLVGETGTRPSSIQLWAETFGADGIRLATVTYRDPDHFADLVTEAGSPDRVACSVIRSILADLNHCFRNLQRLLAVRGAHDTVYYSLPSQHAQAGMSLADGPDIRAVTIDADTVNLELCAPDDSEPDAASREWLETISAPLGERLVLAIYPDTLVDGSGHPDAIVHHPEPENTDLPLHIYNEVVNLLGPPLSADTARQAAAALERTTGEADSRPRHALDTGKVVA
ncbi:hypothetical protein [Nocardia altamirensis]|uniref:hypothetical protein n=1 Tax=Nocardia altamirensis TaxID=472158 RepID=UPI0008407441|nr:hypothetical protein [Nocardia altamirensis]